MEMNRKPLRNPKIYYGATRPRYENKTKSINYRLGGGITVLILLVAVAYGLWRAPFLRIKDIVIEPSDQTIISEMSAIKGDFLFGPSIDREVRKILNSNYAIKSMVCNKGIPSTLSCQLVWRVPQAIWVNNGVKFYIDENGYIYEDTRAAGDGLIAINDVSSKPIKQGEIAISPKILAEYKNIKDKLFLQGKIVSSVNIYDTYFQPEMVLNSGQKIDFNLGWSIEQQLMTLKKFYEAGKDINNGTIDLRVPGYVYAR